jgi:hypothetical protein
MKDLLTSPGHKNVDPKVRQFLGRHSMAYCLYRCRYVIKEALRQRPEAGAREQTDDQDAEDHGNDLRDPACRGDHPNWNRAVFDVSPAVLADNGSVLNLLSTELTGLHKRTFLRRLCTRRALLNGDARRTALTVRIVCVPA